MVVALSDAPDDGDVLSLSRRYRSTFDRMRRSMTSGAVWRTMALLPRPGERTISKFDIAAAAHALLMESGRLFIAVFRRRTETVADIAVVAGHAFVLLDREVTDNPPTCRMIR